ncbi:homoserine dehydrogenase [Bartonella sp. TP]|uniref:NAD(P)H-dependent oxidoreductase n=1 Tax=Bartonella sp. TP TaxID=3057550 RepID=UPI0025B1BD1F|nr:homoserine dehydrogenase [Bartonella sp. TP]WJW79648.1 homoserine dehydrogenase [Bartonella sp. TP]
MASNVYPAGLALDLKERELSGKPIRIGLVGCGEMGTDFLCRVALMSGIEVSHIVSRRIEPILDALKLIPQYSHQIITTESKIKSLTAIEQNKIIVSSDLNSLLENDLIDVIVDATGHPEAGAQIGYQTLQHNKHLVMMNVEADVTIGPYLNLEAKKHGLLYSLGAGDEPSACMELINFISAMGHNIIAAGKGKNNPLHFEATPDEYNEEAARRNMNVRMLVEFIDGSKTMVEMAAIANATGLILDKPAMHGADISLENLAKILIPIEDGGILHNKGVVDYTIGKGVAPGVFAIAEIRQPRLRARMKDLSLGNGPYYSFYRPYHLTAMEVPLTCARMVLYGKADMAPMNKPVAEVCAVAKKNLLPGDKLDFIGLYTYRAFTMNRIDAQKSAAWPCGLLEGAMITKAVNKGELLTKANTSINEKLFIAELRTKQDKIIY